MLKLNQPLSSESLSYWTSNTKGDARLDVAATSFGTVMVKVHSLMLECLTLLHKPMSVKSLATCYRKHEYEKRRIYEQRVRDVEHGFLFFPN